MTIFSLISNQNGLKEDPPKGDPPKLLIGLIPGIPIVPIDIGDMGEPKPPIPPIGLPLNGLLNGELEPKELKGDEPPPKDEKGELPPEKGEKGELPPENDEKGLRENCELLKLV